MVQLEEAVGKNQGTVLLGGEDIFCGIVDGVRQQVDVIAAFLDVSNVLYVSFQRDVAVFIAFATECFQADIMYIFVVENAVVHSIFHVTFQIIAEPVLKSISVFGQDQVQVCIQWNGLLIRLAHDARMSGITEFAGGRVKHPPTDECGFLYLI